MTTLIRSTKNRDICFDKMHFGSDKVAAELPYAFEKTLHRHIIKLFNNRLLDAIDNIADVVVGDVRAGWKTHSDFEDSF